ncbi:MAG: hypothetical protein HY307_01735 [Arcobacter sp.]|nr:hypothetical protein [Arcobacter sp.]
MSNQIGAKNYKQFVYVIGFILIILVVFVMMAKNQNMIVVKDGNANKTPYELVGGKYQDSDCGMVINDMKFVSQVVSNDGKTWFFHDHGGMANWLKNKPLKTTATIWVMSLDTKIYIDGRKAWYSRIDTTPMGYGFGAYENKKDGLIDFEEMFLHMVRGEHLKNPQIRASLLKEIK